MKSSLFRFRIPCRPASAPSLRPGSRFARAAAAGLALLFAAAVPLAGQSAPADFDQDDFDRITRIAEREYLEPGRIGPHLTFAGAAEAGLRVLPYRLILWPRAYLDVRQRYEEIPAPGQIIAEPDNGRPYVIFRPDHAAWEKARLAQRDEERARMEALSPDERAAEAREERRKRQEAQRFIHEEWRKMGFSRMDYAWVINWIRENKEDYETAPPSLVAEAPADKAETEAGDGDASEAEEIAGSEVRQDEFAMNRVYFAAINGYLGALDPHSAVISQADWERMVSEAADATFEGIGALLRGGGLDDVVVETPLANSPALQAGLKAGDVIRRVDGRSIERMPLTEVVRLIRGPKETYVILTVERVTEPEPIDVKILRGVIEQKSVSSRYLEDENVGVIKISSFLYKEETVTELVVNEYNKLVRLSNRRMRGLVLDLRGNSGGDLQEAVRVSGLFLPYGVTVVQVKSGQDAMRELRNPIDQPIRDPRSSSLPLIVLIDSGSASASEIFASALMDHDAALILGERSFGKATVQKLIPTGDVLAKLTIARYYAPDGYTCQVYGVHPDIKVSDEADGGFPLSFREEDMMAALPELQDRKPDPAREAWVEKLKAEVGDNQAAENYIAEHKADARRPDYMLIRALSYLDALGKHPRPER